MAFCFITSLLSPMCMTHSFICCMPLNSSCTTGPPSASVFRSISHLFFCEHFCYMLCNCCVHLCDYVWILACFYYVCCIALKSLQHCFKHMLVICVCYDIWFIVCYYVQTYSINQRSTGVSTCPALRRARPIPALLTVLCLVCTQGPHILLRKSNTGETQSPKQFTDNYCICSPYRSVE